VQRELLVHSVAYNVLLEHMTVKTMQAEVAITLQHESVIVPLYRHSFHMVNELSGHDQQM
jgi:hypothetical protein